MQDQKKQAQQVAAQQALNYEQLEDLITSAAQQEIKAKMFCKLCYEYSVKPTYEYEQLTNATPYSFLCRVYIASLQVGSGEAGSKIEARQLAWGDALQYPKIETLIQHNAKKEIYAKDRLKELYRRHQIPYAKQKLNIGISPPQYELIKLTGPAHDQQFTVKVTFHKAVAVGEGITIGDAEEQAAKNLLRVL